MPAPIAGGIEWGRQEGVECVDAQIPRQKPTGYSQGVYSKWGGREHTMGRDCKVGGHTPEGLTGIGVSGRLTGAQEQEPKEGMGSAGSTRRGVLHRAPMRELVGGFKAGREVSSK